MVDKKDIKSVNKSDEIRKLAAAMKERGEKPRPVVIVATLKKQGVVVSSPQVSMVLKRMGFRPRQRRKAGEIAAAKGAKGAKVAKSAKVRVVRTGQLSIDDLLAAKKIVEQFGSADRAIAAIAALKRFEG
jgi:predicted nucleic acid-binding protein